MAPTTSKGSAPSITAAGSGTDVDSCERSCWQAKKRMNGRRWWVAWSRIVPRSAGYCASTAGLLHFWLPVRDADGPTAPGVFLDTLAVLFDLRPTVTSACAPRRHRWPAEVDALKQTAR